MTRLSVAALVVALLVPTVANAGFFRDYWAPRDGECAIGQTDAREAVAQSLDTCRVEAQYVDAYGTPKVNSFALATCMGAQGFERISKTECTEWSADCAQQASTEALSGLASVQHDRVALAMADETCLETVPVDTDFLAADRAAHDDEKE